MTENDKNTPVVRPNSFNCNWAPEGCDCTDYCKRRSEAQASSSTRAPVVSSQAPPPVAWRHRIKDEYGNTSTWSFSATNPNISKHILYDCEPLYAFPSPTLTDELTNLVARFSAALLEKLRASEKKYRWRNGWMEDTWRESCQLQFNAHVAKGDPIDVAAYCAFMWHHGWAPSALSGTGEAGEFAYAHELYCNADRRFEVGCDGCSCHAGREIKRLRAALTRVSQAITASPSPAPGGVGDLADALNVAKNIISGPLLMATRERNYVKADEYQSYIDTIDFALRTASESAGGRAPSKEVQRTGRTKAGNDIGGI